MSKYEIQRTTQFKKDYKVAVKRGFDTSPDHKVEAKSLPEHMESFIEKNSVTRKEME